MTDDGAKYIINFLNGKSKTDLAIILLNRWVGIWVLGIENDIAYCIADLQSALNRRHIQSPKLREQWMSFVC